MKRLIAATLIATVTATSAFAHGGGLNSQGCHNQHSNNTYHCHRQNNDLDDAGKALGALIILGVLAGAMQEASCNKEWRVLQDNHNHVVIGEVNCRGQILQTQTVYR